LIYALNGTIMEKKPDCAVLNVNGIFFGINIPLTTFHKLNALEQTDTLFTHLVHKEDRMELYGFKDKDSLGIFKLLISLPGLGPKLALVLLSHLSPEELKAVVASQNADRLKSISGIGAKKAEKILFELKNKFKDLPGEGIETGSAQDNDFTLALKSLGYSAQEIGRVLRDPDVADKKELEEKVKAALRKLQ